MSDSNVRFLPPRDVKNVFPLSAMEDDGPEDGALLREMLERAKNYLCSFEWCPGVVEAYFGGGIGGVVAAFLLKIDEHHPPHVDDWVWVIVGDVPSAYLWATDGVDALQWYCRLMDDWTDAARGKRALAEVFPVRAPASAEYAKMLSSRTRMIREEVLPQIELQVQELVAKAAKAT